MVGQRIRECARKVQDTDACDSRRARFPRALYAKPRILHGASTGGLSIETDGLPRRRPLDPEAAERRAVVRYVPRLARDLPSVAFELTCILSRKRRGTARIFRPLCVSPIG